MEEGRWERGDTDAKKKEILQAVANDVVSDLLKQKEVLNPWILRAAVIYEAEKVVAYCLERIIDPDFPDKDGFTPLHHAAITGNEQISKMLIDKGASPTARTQERIMGRLGDVAFGSDLAVVGDRTPLHLAAEEARLTITRLLLAKGADKTSRDADGSTPFDCCLQRADTDTLSTERSAVAELLRLDDTIPSYHERKMHTREKILARRNRFLQRRTLMATTTNI